MPRTDTIPNATIITTTTKTVIGFLTLNFGIIFSSNYSRCNLFAFIIPQSSLSRRFNERFR